MPRRHKWELGAVAALAVATAVAGWAVARHAPAGMIGRYWNNAEWRGQPATQATGTVPSIGDFHNGLADAATNVGSADWSGYLLVESSGTHQFDLLSDDGGWLDVDGSTVVDNGGAHGAQQATGSVSLQAGIHRLRVRYFQGGGDAALRITWTRPGGPTRRLEYFDVAPTSGAAQLRLRLGRFGRLLSVALPVLWGLLFLYIPVRLVGWLTWREVTRQVPRVEDRRPLKLVLAVGVALMVWGIGFGLGQGWPPDELGPGEVRRAFLSGFSNGWHEKYPLMHFAVLSIPLSAFEIAGRLAILPFDSPVSDAAQVALARLVSLLAGVGCLVVVFLCTAELTGARRAVAGSVALLLTPLFLYYSKTANLDVPSLFWFGWAMLGFVRIIRYNRLADYLLLGTGAAAAVATKDQHYANLALLPIAVLLINALMQPSPTWSGRLGRALVDSKLWMGAAAAVGASAVLHNMIFNFSGFVAHVEELVGYGPILPLVPATAAGYYELTRRTGELFALGMGWAWFGAALFGVVVAAVRKDRRCWLWLLFVPLSFHLAYTWATRNVHDRYLYGGVFVLTIFAGASLADLVEAGRRTRPARLLAGALTAYSLLYAVSINVMMTRDARYEARQWVHRHARNGTKVGLLGAGEYMPVIEPPALPIRVYADVEGLARVKPELLVVNARYAKRYEARPEGRVLLAGLDDGSLGYREVFRYRAPIPAWALLQYAAPFSGTRESILTNLDKVNPEMVIYQRAGH